MIHHYLKKTCATAVLAGATLAVLLAPTPVKAFCGFYVAKADTQLFNNASKVVVARKDDRTVITMANDYEGDLKEFAMVIPVPTFLEREQINVTENTNIEHLDAYSAPRLVEYFDEDPCSPRIEYMMKNTMAGSSPSVDSMVLEGADEMGVTIEAEYTIGEYDILILSAKESDGLQKWLDGNGYKTPKKARDVLESYIKQGTKFFVAKVNLEEKSKLGGTYLRPIQIAFESPKFMLPIRLGTVNAKESQELFVFLLTPQGRAETTNYRTVKLPTGMDLPIYVKEQFGDFYKAMFNQQVMKEKMKAVFLEYAWNMNWCDPCAADPLSAQQLRELGVWWQNKPDMAQPQIWPPQRRIMPPQAQQVYVTRLHLRYNADTFPEDLIFRETSDTSNFQGRYVLRHPWKGGTGQCSAAADYLSRLPARFEKEARSLANITGWDINDIRAQMKNNGQSFDKPKTEKWWKTLWN